MTAGAGPRRRHRRGDPPAVAFVVLDGRAPSGPFIVENLSAGGALLTGETRQLEALASDAISVGRSLVVQLRLPTASHWLHATATIVRGGTSGENEAFSFAVRFRNLSFDVEDAIQSAVLASLEEGREDEARTILMLVEEVDDREALARALVDSRRRPIAALTPLDVLRLVESPELAVEAVLVAVTFARGSPFDVLCFFADEFPAVRRVLLVASDREDPAIAAALSSGVAQAMLSKPFARDRVAHALVVENDGEDC